MPHNNTAPRSESEFLFGPDTEMWRINRERCGLIFGPAAAILQVAHPRIAQGVHDHSDFRSDALGRLQRTLAGTNSIAFGTLAEAEAMKARIDAAHRVVRGTVSPGVSGPSRYSAFEPDLLVWVLATLISAAVQGYEFIYGPLPIERKEAFYRDMCRFGTWFGVDEADCPAGWKEFAHYYDAMIHGTELGSHPLCGKMARAVVHPRDSIAVRGLGLALDFLPIETLPPGVRDRLGLRSTAWTRLRLRAVRSLLPRIFPRLPASVRCYPEYLRAMGR